jgi:hypothetical protein
MAKKKLGRNDPCWCGSGKKFKKCHADRSAQTPYQYHELAKDLVRLRRGDETCLYPQAVGTIRCSRAVIKAHSISRSAALSKIARLGQVYQLDLDPFQLQKHGGKIQHRLVGISKASTFTGFCSQHDASLFKSIDIGDLVPTQEQAFFLHYRALCRELYVKRTALPTNELLRNLDRGKPPDKQAFVQEFVDSRSRAIQTSIRELEADKNICDEAIIDGKFIDFHCCALLFNQVPSLACSGLTQPAYDFAGRTLQNLIDLEQPSSRLSFTLLPSGVNGVGVFAWTKGADPVCRAFVNSFLSVPDDRKSDAIVQFIFDSFENHAIQPDFWEDLPEELKSEAHQRLLNWTDVRPVDPKVLIPGKSIFANWGVRNIVWF